MAQKQFITVAIEDVHTMVVGSLAAFTHKRLMANDPEYLEEKWEKARQPRTMREMLGLTAPIPMMEALGLT